jgi:DNA-dependent RNA polymerase auxiliary subunit epsilon
MYLIYIKKKLRIKERKRMIYKVFYQESNNQVAVREKTKTLYVNADSERDVRKKLADKFFNIEYVQLVQGAFLEYEQKNEDFKVLEIG